MCVLNVVKMSSKKKDEFYCRCKKRAFIIVPKEEKIKIVEKFKVKMLSVALWECYKCNRYVWSM